MKIDNKRLTSEQSKAYLLKHGVPVTNGQILLMEPLFVFKKVKTYASYTGENDTYVEKMRSSISAWASSPAIASLIIPVGSLVNPNVIGSLKCRAEKAFCYSIVRISDLKEVSLARSIHDSDFVYKSLKAQGYSQKTVEEYARNWRLPYKTNLGSKKIRGSTEIYSKSTGLHKSIILPNIAFDQSPGECRSGIHFYLHSTDALAN